MVLAAMEHVRMTRGIRNLVESLFTQLKRRLASFAGYFLRESIERVRGWIWTWDGFYNLSKSHFFHQVKRGCGWGNG